MYVSCNGLACPFCGSKVIEIGQNLDEAQDEPFFCWCSYCGARGPEFYDPALAKAYWNTISIKAKPKDYIAQQEKWIRLVQKDKGRIRPCPICGKAPKLVHKRHDEWPDCFGLFRVVCEECDCRGPEHLPGTAIKMWNEKIASLADLSTLVIAKALEARKTREIASGETD